ncbi:hypothetical protein FKP32DRAFT_678655 [Trametes sanguinea]|nr:hypothetical protein FKP32DRAFT_678655 [Trametes sanguinea]
MLRSSSSDLTYESSRRPHQSLPETPYIQRPDIDSGSYATSAAAQSAYHCSPYQGFMHSSSASSPDPQAPVVGANSWQSHGPSQATLRRSPGSQSPYSDTSATSYNGSYSRDGQYHTQPAYGEYSSSAYQDSPLPSHHNSGTFTGAIPPSFPGTSGYPAVAASASLGYPAHSMYPARPRAPSPPRCEWGACRAILEDQSPSGIARHLKQYHNVQVTDNRNRDQCLWGARRCGKDMYPSSYGKHIAECHLRNMVKQCPHCGADFARADTLSRHIKSFCPNSSG